MKKIFGILINELATIWVETNGIFRALKIPLPVKLDPVTIHVFDFKNRNGDARKVTDVYFIPNLRSNIISLGQATKSGYDVRMKGE